MSTRKSTNVLPKHIRFIDLSVILLSMGAIQTNCGNELGRFFALLGIAVMSTSGSYFTFVQRSHRTCYTVLAVLLGLMISYALIEHVGLLLFVPAVGTYAIFRTYFNSELKQPRTSYRTLSSKIFMDLGVFTAYSSTFLFLLNHPDAAQTMLSSGVVLYIFARVFSCSKTLEKLHHDKP